jgi:23S rRNA (pseudouridine1915-N3)-methyltransferase
MARSLHLIVVGKLKDQHLLILEAEYLKRLNSPSLTIYELKARAENPMEEGEEILKKLTELKRDQPCFKIALSEWGKNLNTLEFSDWSSQLLTDGHGKLVFIISGAQGFSEEVLQECDSKLSLSKLTFPHKLARIILIEQLYRVQTIRLGHPYHN